MVIRGGTVPSRPPLVTRKMGVRPDIHDYHLHSMKHIAILGSTGSIGRSTLRVAEAYPERFQIVALAAGSNLEAAFEQARRWRPMHRFGRFCTGSPDLVSLFTRSSG